MKIITNIIFFIGSILILFISINIYNTNKTYIEPFTYEQPGIDPVIKFELADTVLNFLDKSPKDGLMDALIYYNIHHPEIVYAQAIIESKLGKSDVYKRTNNLFGLYDSNKRDYYKFDHWSESVELYRDKIQNRYKTNEDYYSFLKRIGYATDPNYIDKLRKIKINNN